MTAVDVDVHRPQSLQQASGTRVDIVRAASIAAAVIATSAGLAGLLGEQVLGPLVVALLIGLPHGAVDHLAIARRIAGTVGWALGTVGYAGMAAATFLLLGLAPLVGWTAFLVLSVLHFGTADREYLAQRGRRPSAVFALAVGALPVAALMVGDPDSIRPLAEAIDPSVALLLAPAVLTAVTWGTAAAVLIAAGVEIARRNAPALIDLVVLVALFAVVPPLWAFGVYFGLWHAVRHVGRMVREERPWSDITARAGVAASARRFAVDAVPPTLIAIGAMTALLVLGPGGGGVAVTAVALQVTAAVTFPHALTVAWLDRAR
jgi:beta-carotene 15,15'-dioxygenase